MEELIKQLGQMVAENMKAFPNARLDLLVDELNEAIARNPQLTKSIRIMPKAIKLSFKKVLPM